MKQKHYNLKGLDSEILDITAIDSDTCKIYIVTEKGYLYCYNSTAITTAIHNAPSASSSK